MTRQVLRALAVLIVLGELAWLLPLFATDPPPAGSPLSVALGSVGLACMIVMLGYSVARRSRRLRRTMKLSAWLELHIFLGVQGVLLVFFHCWPVFFPPEPRDLNLLNVGMLSLVMTCVVFFSGLLGRYLFGHLPRTLRGESMTARELDVAIAELDKGLPAPVQAAWHGASVGQAHTEIQAMALDQAVRARALRRVAMARRRAGLRRAERVFGLWIVAHRPTAAIMYVLAAVHVAASFVLSELVVLGGLALVAAVLVWGVVAAARQRKAERKARADYERAVSRGAEPPSLYPHIDLERCVGTGACAAACPEKDVIAVVAGKALVVNPTNCIGHGECRAACPVDAITLVIGSARRGVDIPLVRGDFQCTVPGLYVVGELGGMGLIYNAVTQGVQAVRGLARSAPPRVDGVHQLLVVGAGPAGLAAAVTAHHAGLDVVTVDQEEPGGTILQYPRRKLVMTRPFELPGYGRVMLEEVSKEALLEVWHDVIARTGVQVRTRCRVDALRRRDDGIFEAETAQGTILAQRVVLAIGRRGSPRKLGVPGEDSAKVAYRLLEPESWAGARCLVVGGGDSAVEAAVALGECGATVHLSYRRPEFSRIKPKNQLRLEAAVAAGRCTLLTPSVVQEIRPDAVRLDAGGAPVELPNDQVFVFAGGVLPTALLEGAGIEVRRFEGEEFAPANA